MNRTHLNQVRSLLTRANPVVKYKRNKGTMYKLRDGEKIAQACVLLFLAQCERSLKSARTLAIIYKSRVNQDFCYIIYTCSVLNSLLAFHICRKNHHIQYSSLTHSKSGIYITHYIDLPRNK